MLSSAAGDPHTHVRRRVNVRDAGLRPQPSWDLGREMGRNPQGPSLPFPEALALSSGIRLLSNHGFSLLDREAHTKPARADGCE